MLTLRAQADQVADPPPLKLADLPPWYWHLVVKNGNFTFLLVELILADQVADLPPVLASSGQEWQFHIVTVRTHIGRFTGRSFPQYWHLVVKNSNFTFLLLELILADLLADLPPQYWHLVVKNGNFTFLPLELILADQVADLPPSTGI